MRQAHSAHGADGAACKAGDFLVRNLAEQLEVLGFPLARAVEHPDAKPDAFELNGVPSATQFLSQIGIWHRAKEPYFRRLPITKLGAGFGGGDTKGNSLAADLMLGAPKTTRKLVVVHPPKELDFPHGPGSRPGFHGKAQMLAHGDDFFDGPAAKAGENGIGRFAQPFEFAQGP